MEQEKIGKFIAELRKEKSMTQLDLAKILGVTDRAISKWENGRGMPDLSLIRPLCDALDITINELFCAQRIESKEFVKKSEENIINTLNYSNVKIKKNKRKAGAILGLILICIILTASMFAIDIKRMNNNEPVMFSTWGFDYFPPVNLDEQNIQIAIKDYINNLESKNSITIEDTRGNIKYFTAIKTYLIEEKATSMLYNVYCWVYCAGYKLENNQPKLENAFSIPYMFTVENIEGTFIVKDAKKPRDGTYYPVDMKNIFPSSVLDNMDKVHYDGTIEQLQLEVKEQVKLYFDK